MNPTHRRVTSLALADLTRFWVGEKPAFPLYSEHFQHISAAPPDAKLFYLGRISNRSQNKEVMPIQLRLYKSLFNIVDYELEVASGYVTGIHDRWKLERLVERALPHQPNAYLLTETPSRFLRSRKFNSKEGWWLTPTKEEFSKFHEITHHLPCLTIYQPDLSPEEERKMEIRRGQLLSGVKNYDLSKAREMARIKRKEGFSYAQISACLFLEGICLVSKHTIRYWCS